MHAALTVRKLKPGSYEDWRKAWEPDEWPQGVKAYILRNVDDPDEVIAFGLFEPGVLDGIRSDPSGQEQERARLERLAPYVASTGADGIYHVEEVRPPS